MDKEWIPAFAESTPRIEKKYSGGKDGRRREGRINYLVVLADAGTHTSWQGWIPVPDKNIRELHPSHWKEMLGG